MPAVHPAAVGPDIKVPFAKGYLGVDYRTLLGLQRSSSPGSSFKPGDPTWDVYVEGLPFMLAPSEDRPYLRESSPIGRQRLDAARDPGEQSLNPSVWTRSFTSWHLGAGQDYAEPLESDPEVARFRFARSGGLDPWTSGQISLLPASVQKKTLATAIIGIDGVGVLTACGGSVGVRVITPTTDVQVSSSNVLKLAASAEGWVGMIADKTLVHGTYAPGTGAGTAVTGITGVTALNFAKDRWWVGCGNVLRENAEKGGATSTIVHTFSAAATIVDIDTGAGGIYVMVNDGMTRIYVISAKEDGALTAPREVAVLPRGERGNFLYGYLGKYVVIGTSRGVRIADAVSTEALPIGPLIIEMKGGCVDATADSNFVWVTGGTEGVEFEEQAGTAVLPCLYRMDLSRVVKEGQAYGDTAASRYAYATDLFSTTGTSALAVTRYGGKTWFITGVSGTPEGTLFMEGDTLVAEGWFETGNISFSTAEAKAWQSIVAEVQGEGAVEFFGNSGAGFSRLVTSPLAPPFSGDAEVDTFVHVPSGYMNLRLQFYRLISATGPIMLSYGLRCFPNPRRTRYIRIPLMCFDNEVDRNGSPVGYDGFSYDRLADLEQLEERGGLVAVTDGRTGELIKCQIEKVNFEAVTPPSKAIPNFGGFVTLTLLKV